MALQSKAPRLNCPVSHRSFLLGEVLIPHLTPLYQFYDEALFNGYLSDALSLVIVLLLINKRQHNPV